MASGGSLDRLQRRVLPEGVVSLVFSDIEGSTRLLAALGRHYASALREHREIVRAVAAAELGAEVDTQGDAFLLAFADARRAVAAAVAVHRALARHRWPDDVELRVRIGVHSGALTRLDEGYVGLPLHVGARIAGIAGGGQVLLSAATADLVGDALPEGASRRSVGRHRLKDLDQPLDLFDLVVEDLPSRFPPLRSLGRRDTNLPPAAPALRFRDAEAAEAIALLRGGARLVTLVGPGGSGKTTLGLHVAAAVLEDFPEGVLLVRLTPLRDADLVPAAIAQALGLRDQPNRSRAQVLLEYLEGRRALLVLDNLEHLLGATSFVEELLTSAPEVRLLVTSRTATRLPAEREVGVQPLPTRSSGAVESAAVQLFVQRAQAAKPGFVLDDANRAAVRSVCEELDGLPLAIELAAARVRVMTPAAMARRLERPLELAAGGAGSREARQQTLHSTIDWGYRLLTAGQQTLLAQLSVFSGAFTLDAAESVCDAGLDDVASLLDNSLLRSVEGGPDDIQMQLLFTVRAFAQDRLEQAGLAHRTRERHAAWCAELGASAGPELLDGRHEQLLPRFDLEQDDVRAALDWLASQGRVDEVLSLCADMATFWDTRGLWTEAAERLRSALLAAPDAPAERRAKALFALGRISVQQSNTSDADAALLEALDHYSGAHDARGIVLCTSHLAWSAGLQPGRADECVRLAREALRIARASEDPWTIAVALNNLADEDVDDEPAHRAALLRESAALRRELGERRPLSITLENLGKVEFELGRLADARTAAEEALSLALDVGYTPGIASSRHRLAQVALARGDRSTAEAEFAVALRLAEQLGDLETQVGCLRGLAAVADHAGDPQQRDHDLERARRIARTGAVVFLDGSVRARTQPDDSGR